MKDRRDAARIPVAISVHYRYRMDAEFFCGQALDLSSTGLLIRSEAPAEPGDALCLALHLPGDPLPVEAEGIVARAHPRDDGSGAHQYEMGVRFVSIEASDRLRLANSIIESWCRSERRTAEL